MRRGRSPAAAAAGGGGGGGGGAAAAAAGGGGSAAVRPEKAIVFSQWTSMLDLLEVPLKKGGFVFRRLDGTMTVAARERAIADFESCPEVGPDWMGR
jgi:SNF2 family DNA or RNA helicase